MDYNILNGKDDFVVSYVSLKYIVINIVKTYLWIKATANSNKIKIINGMLYKWKIIILFIQRPIKMCPAVKLAAKRTDNVIGRIICLIVSIITINWERIIGVPKGTMWLIKWGRL